MFCEKCKREIDGYRCPYCGNFFLEDPKYQKKKSAYGYEKSHSMLSMLPKILFIVLVAGGLILTLWLIFHQDMFMQGIFKEILLFYLIQDMIDQVKIKPMLYTTLKKYMKKRGF